MQPNELIIEGLVTTLAADGAVNIAPMGPIATPAIDWLLLRPFQTSTTFTNLRQHGAGVFHVTDNALMLARAAIGQLAPQPELLPCAALEGRIIADACRWHAFRVERIDDRQPRAQIWARVVDSGSRRDFLGFNRAKHAVVEAAILATRVGILSADEIQAELARLTIWIEKTGSADEHQALALLRRHIDAALSAPMASAQSAPQAVTS